jgi:protein-S-isoprenylcysteine O-methyltransferase Ste14
MSQLLEQQLFDLLLIGFGAFALAAVVLVSWISAPYGRHQREGWGPAIPARLAWVIMESISVWGFCACFVVGARQSNPVAITFFLLWMVHYLHRAFIYPLRARMGSQTMPLLIFVIAVIFNSFNSYLNGRYLFTLGPELGNDWFTDPRFVIGVLLFGLGSVANRHSDAILRRLREPGEKGYKIPHGGLFEWVSCPNYLAEIVMWMGWAIATWCVPGLLFALWTVANLAPRARSHHAWYQQEFADYPTTRKALIPGLW